MKEKQKEQFNQMLAVLKRIARDYQTPKQLRKKEGQYGLSFEEEIEMAYENIQNDATNAIRRVRKI